MVDTLASTEMLTLQTDGEEPDQIGEVVAQRAETRRRLSDLLRQLPVAAAPPVAGLGLIGVSRRAVDQEWLPAFEQVIWDIDPAAESNLHTIPPMIVDVLFYATREAIRNSDRHARGEDTGHPLHLTIRVLLCEGLEIQVEDDGSGIQQGGSEAAGTRQGLARHSTMMAVIGGTLVVQSQPGAYTRVNLALPLEK